MKKRFLIGLLTIGLSACATFTPSSQITSGNVTLAIGQWDSAAISHPNEPAPKWAKDLYAERLKTINALESEIKEMKTFSK